MQKTFNAVIKSNISKLKSKGWPNTGGPYIFKVEIENDLKLKEVSVLVDDTHYRIIKNIIIPDKKCQLVLEKYHFNVFYLIKIAIL